MIRSYHFCSPTCGCQQRWVPTNWVGHYTFGPVEAPPRGRRPTDFNQRAPTAPCKRCGRQGVGKCGCRGGR